MHNYALHKHLYFKAKYGGSGVKIPMITLDTTELCVRGLSKEEYTTRVVIETARLADSTVEVNETLRTIKELHDTTMPRFRRSFCERLKTGEDCVKTLYDLLKDYNIVGTTGVNTGLKFCYTPIPIIPSGDVVDRLFFEIGSLVLKSKQNEDKFTKVFGSEFVFELKKTVGELISEAMKNNLEELEILQMEEELKKNKPSKRIPVPDPINVTVVNPPETPLDVREQEPQTLYKELLQVNRDLARLEKELETKPDSFDILKDEQNRLHTKKELLTEKQERLTDFLK